MTSAAPTGALAPVRAPRRGWVANDQPRPAEESQTTAHRAHHAEKIAGRPEQVTSGFGCLRLETEQEPDRNSQYKRPFCICRMQVR